MVQGDRNLQFLTIYTEEGGGLSIETCGPIHGHCGGESEQTVNIQSLICAGQCLPGCSRQNPLPKGGEKYGGNTQQTPSQALHNHQLVMTKTDTQ